MTNSLPEARRNALLRRVDWRFLLRLAEEPRLLEPTDGELGDAAAYVFPAAGTHDADLAALTAPSEREIAAAAGALNPGGHVYAEWRLVRPSTARARLRSAGLVDVRAYQAWPPRRDTQLWLPLDAPRALTAFLGLRGGGRRRALLRQVWRLAHRLDLPLPLACIGRTAGGEDDEIDRSVDIGSNERGWVLLTGGRRSINKVVALLVTPDGPALAVKFARTQADEEPLQREADALRGVEAARPELEGVPRVAFTLRRSGRLAVGESFVPGTPLLDRLTAETFRPSSVAVTQWLVRLAARSARVSPAEWSARLVHEPLATLVQQFAGVISHEEASAARATLATLPELPLVIEHRDCSPWNVLVDDRGAPALVDWESAELAGLPGLDLAYFLTYASFFHDATPEPPEALAAYERSLDPQTPTGRVVDECEALYCDALGIERRTMTQLRLLCWIVHCRSEYRHAALATAGSPARDALEHGLFVELFRAQLARARSQSS